MIKVIKNYRYWLLLIVATVAMCGTFAVPEETLPLSAWLWVLVSTKAVGFGAWYVGYRLIRRWEKRGTIPELIEFSKDF